ncbi:MAG TPA: hypothetical protein VN894_05485 [Polyangiaceae bacterium]|nr:hypothetical protein [Polyangiaceae bacterium]
MQVYRAALVAILPLAMGGCASYQYAKGVKLISFEDGIAAGQAVGPVTGKNCQASVMGYPLGEAPTLDKAFADARKSNGTLRYMNNVYSENTGFNAYFYAKRCISVKGTGYK